MGPFVTILVSPAGPAAICTIGGGLEIAVAAPGATAESTGATAGPGGGGAGGMATGSGWAKATSGAASKLAPAMVSKLRRFMILPFNRPARGG